MEKSTSRRACQNGQARLAASEPFENRKTFVCISGTKDGIHNARQENKKSDQKVAKLATLQILIKSSSNEDGKSNNPNRAVPAKPMTSDSGKCEVRKITVTQKQPNSGVWMER